MGNLLKGQTVGVIGAGRIGSAYARMMVNFCSTLFSQMDLNFCWTLSDVKTDKYVVIRLKGSR